MTVQVRVPTILRDYTSGEREVSAQGATIGEVIDDLDHRYPGIKGRILDESGKLRRFINVYLDDEDVRFREELDTPTAEGAVVSVIPAVAGGC